jgi:hypothetical protein
VKPIGIRNDRYPTTRYRSNTDRLQIPRYRSNTDRLQIPIGIRRSNTNTDRYLKCKNVRPIGIRNDRYPTTRYRSNTDRLQIPIGIRRSNEISRSVFDTIGVKYRSVFDDRKPIGYKYRSVFEMCSRSVFEISRSVFNEIPIEWVTMGAWCVCAVGNVVTRPTTTVIQTRFVPCTTTVRMMIRSTRMLSLTSIRYPRRHSCTSK